MRFEEEDYIDLTNTPTTFIYFLLQDDEVVYVGQTKRGLARVYHHMRDKRFNKIYIIECDISELDYWETFYMFKYKPIYNKKPNPICTFSIKKIVNKLNKAYKSGVFGSKITKSKVRDMITVLNIKPREYNGEYYIGIDDYCDIIAHIEDFAKGAPTDEVFNIGI